MVNSVINHDLITLCYNNFCQIIGVIFLHAGRPLATQWIREETAATRRLLLLLQQEPRVLRQRRPQNEDVCLLTTEHVHISSVYRRSCRGCCSLFQASSLVRGSRCLGSSPGSLPPGTHQSHSFDIVEPPPKCIEQYDSHLHFRHT